MALKSKLSRCLTTGSPAWLNQGYPGWRFPPLDRRPGTCRSSPARMWRGKARWVASSPRLATCRGARAGSPRNAGAARDLEFTDADLSDRTGATGRVAASVAETLFAANPFECRHGCIGNSSSPAMITRSTAFLARLGIRRSAQGNPR